MKYLKISALLLAILASASCSANKSKPQAATPSATKEASQTSLDNGSYIVYFETNSSKLSDESIANLNNSVIPMIKSASGKKVAVKIEGHCDERGSALYNKALGRKRAEAVKSLILKANKSAKVSIVSYGESRPVALGHDEESWAKNRRSVVISIK